jgi:hypothetical protein
MTVLCHPQRSCSKNWKGRFAYFKWDKFDLNYFVYFGLSKSSNHLWRTYHTKIVHPVDIHHADYSLDGSFVFIAKFDCIK